jgi:uncharacterized protein YqgV (UPF0045/DUF77 family)
MAMGELSCRKGKTMKVQMEVSLYPLGIKRLGAPIQTFVTALEKEGFDVDMGAMSSFVTGESAKLFPALGRAFEKIAQQHHCVLNAKISNACPVIHSEPNS